MMYLSAEEARKKEHTMSIYGSIKEDVKAYLGEHVDDFDVDGIVSDIKAAGITDVDDMDEDDFLTIIQAHDMSGR